MNERLRKGLVFSTLPIALIWAYFNLFGKKPAVTPTSDPALATVAPLSAPISSAPASDSATVARLKAQPWGNDPFRGRPAHVSTATAATVSTQPTKTGGDNLSFVLSGIMFNTQNPIAYVNGRPVKVGQTINSAKVISIERKSVVLDLNGRRLTLSIGKEARS